MKKYYPTSVGSHLIESEISLKWDKISSYKLVCRDVPPRQDFRLVQQISFYDFFFIETSSLHYLAELRDASIYFKLR